VDNTTAHQVAIMSAIYGDANLDGVVDSLDLAIVQAHYGQSGMSWAQGDFNYDGVVDAIDLSYV
jgi:hypothetical protein